MTMLNCNRNLYKLYNVEGRMVGMLTARSEQAAVQAYRADNKSAQIVARIEQCTWGFPSEIFSTWEY
ncbi:MAG: hypothetical protein ACOVOX_03960 [Burkholderiaceae bacterium]